VSAASSPQNLPSSAPPAPDRPFANRPKDHKRKPRQKRKRKTGVQVKRARARTGLAAALLDRHQIVALTGLTYPTIWGMMCRGAFPRGRVVNHKTAWLASEVEAWIAALPISRLREQLAEEKIEECQTA
jgi:predicted DNA-binding transcriptional regulator AlpA